MDLDEFRASLAQDRPPAGLPPAVQALWWDGKQDWSRAHDCASADDGRAAAWVHAYLHRKEGDPGNAGYWYRRAGQAVPQQTLQQEWAAIAGALLARPEADRDAPPPFRPA